jgi:pimeloyl-ACP methyl ester carboxylesterase
MTAIGATVQDRRGEVAGLPVFWREARAAGVPVLYVHGVPTNSDDWVPFLERTGGVAPDLPGFGRSAKPASFDYSIAGYNRFLEAFVDHLGLQRFSLVVHDWGGLALALPPHLLARLERLVSINAVPLGVPGYRWHPVARIWRTPLLGELFMGFSTRWGFKRMSGGAWVGEGPLPDDFIDRIWAHFDHGTQRAILKLYRSAPAATLEHAANLEEIRCRALVVWGARDPYIDAPRFAPATADALGGSAELELIDDASHWAWIDRPDLVDRIAGFLTG